MAHQRRQFIWAGRVLAESLINVDGQIMTESEFRRWVANGAEGPREILSCECGKETCPRARLHTHYRSLGGGDDLRPCQSPAEFCAGWLADYERPVGTVEETIAKALEYFASRPDLNVERFESLLQARGHARNTHREGEPDDHEDVGGTVALYVLGRWLSFRRGCEAAQRGLSRSSMPGWALYAFEHAGVCERYADDPRRFCLALGRLVSRYTLGEGVDESAWLEALHLLGKAQSTEDLWNFAEKHHNELDSEAVQHLLASWLAYQAAWGKHACGRHYPCGPLPPDQDPYDWLDAYWETLGELSPQIGHRVRYWS